MREADCNGHNFNVNDRSTLSTQIRHTLLSIFEACWKVFHLNFEYVLMIRSADIIVYISTWNGCVGTPHIHKNTTHICSNDFFNDGADWWKIATPFKNVYNWTYKLTKYSWNMKVKLHGLRELKNPENELHIIASSHIMLEIMFLISIKANLWAKTR